MARPSSTRLDRGTDYAPSVSQSPGLGVYAPLNVTAEQSQATQLAQALGIVGETAMPALKKAAFEKGKASAEAGQVDARMGSVDEKRRAADESYRKGAVSVEADQQALDFINEYEKFYAENVDKDSSTQELAQDFDERAKESLGHWLEDRESAGIVSKKLQAYINRKVFDHNQQQIVRREQRAVENAAASVAFDLETTGTVDFNAQAKKIGPIIDQGKANDIVLNAIGQWAIANAAPEILDPEKGVVPKEIVREDGQKIPLGNNPAVARKLQEFQQAAQAEYKKRHAIETETRLANLTKGWQDTIDSGVRLDWQKQILPHVMNGDMTREEALSWYNKSLNQKLEKQTLANDMQLLLSGARWQLKTGDLDADGDQFTQDRFQKAMDAIVQAAPEEQQLAVAMKFSRMHSLPATKFKTQLNSIIATDDALESNLRLYTTLQDQSPDLMHLYVDKGMRGQYEAMLRMQRAGLKPAEIREEIKQRDPDFAREQWDRYGRDVVKAVDKVELPTPGGFLGFGAGTAVSDIGNSDYVRRRIEDQARVLVESGVRGDPEELASKAAKDVYDSHIAVDLGNGRKTLIERWPGAPDDLSQFITYAREKWLKDNEAKLGFDPEDGPVTIDVSQNSNNGRQIVFRQNGYRVGKSASFEGVYAAYEQAVKTDTWNERIRNSNLRKEARAEQKRLQALAEEGFAKIQNGSPKLKY